MTSVRWCSQLQHRWCLLLQQQLHYHLQWMWCIYQLLCWQQPWLPWQYWVSGDVHDNAGCIVQKAPQNMLAMGASDCVQSFIGVRYNMLESNFNKDIKESEQTLEILTGLNHEQLESRHHLHRSRGPHRC